MSQSSVTASAPVVTTTTDSLSLRVFFRQGRSNLEPVFRDNEERLETFISKVRMALADTSYMVSDITITSGASPEGGTENNQQLSENRAKSLCKYLKYSLSLPDSIFRINAIGEDWQGLRQLVQKYNVPHSEEIVGIIDSIPPYIFRDGKIVDGRKKRLMDLSGGAVWNYMLEHIFPELRSSNNNVICHITRRPEAVTQIVTISSHPDTIYINTGQPMSSSEAKVAKKHPFQFAVGTNLLFDLATAINVEVEFPIKNKVSILLEHTFPWWVFNGYALDVLRTGVEVRYWFGNRKVKPLLSGFFAGVYANADKFDVEWKDHGYQGETFADFGATFGWSKKIHKNWRLEISLGLGYFHTRYTEYHHEYDKSYYTFSDGSYQKTGTMSPLLYQKDDDFTWIGPTKLKCTISWIMPDGLKGIFSKKKGGRK